MPMPSSPHSCQILRSPELGERAVGPAAPPGAPARWKEECRRKKAEARICRVSSAKSGPGPLTHHASRINFPLASSATSGRDPLTHHASRITSPLASSAPPAPYATLLGPLAYRLPTAAVSLPLGSADPGPPRRLWFASTAINPPPKPPTRLLSRTVARHLARSHHGIAAR